MASKGTTAGMLVDSHCHLQLPQFDGDRQEVVERARAAGLAAFVVPGIDIETSRKAIALADAHSDIYAAVGVHPHQAATVNGRTLASLRSLANSSKVVAIGEIGLDYYRQLSPPDIQRQVFRQMLALAGQLRLPVVVHSRDAEGDTLEMLTAWEREILPSWPKDRPLGVMHSFAGDLTLALRYIELGFLISIPGTCTRPRAHRICAVAAGLPVRWMVVETDAPFQAPPSQGRRRNEPAYLVETVAKIAELRGTTFQEVAAGTGLAAAWLFGLGDIGEEEYMRQRGMS